ncbi:MAG: hypothetical protein QN174_07625 [Armatimonadota bacterium]|nr:hypothetical protein [Armatimonadota bacterium]
MTTATEERYYSLPEFLAALGIGKRTYLKYRAAGVLPEPPRQGERSVLSQGYLERCRHAWKEYRSRHPLKLGRPRKTATA